MLDDYVPLRLIGRGSQGRAILVRERKNAAQQWVIKQVPIATARGSETAILEGTLLASVHHPSVIAVRETFVERGYFNIVTEYADGGELAGLLERQRRAGARLPETRIWEILWQLSSALAFLHERGIVHRDIKTSNVFLTARGQLKLGDFGLAKVLAAGAKTNTRAGTPVYFSPEICTGAPYDQRTDLWSLGCLLYELMALRPPFVADKLADLYRRIANRDYASLDETTYSATLRTLVSRLLSVQPEQRPAAASIIAECDARRIVSATTHVIDTSDAAVQALLRRRESELKDMRAVLAALASLPSDHLLVRPRGGGSPRYIAAIPLLHAHLERHLSMHGYYELRNYIARLPPGEPLPPSPYAAVIKDLLAVEQRLHCQ